MRTVLVIDEDKLDGKLTNLMTSREPKAGEEVELQSAIMCLPLDVAGKVTNPRNDPNWPGHWLYDVDIG